MEDKIINLDMDGTLVDLYGVAGWLEYLEAHNTTPYRIAKPLVNLSALARVLNNRKKRGYTINIISWLSKSGNPDYNDRVTKAKLEWLAQRLPSVRFDNIYIVDYGTPKSSCSCGILFDDEEANRVEWKGQAYGAENLIENLKALA